MGVVDPQCLGRARQNPKQRDSQAFAHHSPPASTHKNPLRSQQFLQAPILCGQPVGQPRITQQIPFCLSPLLSSLLLLLLFLFCLPNVCVILLRFRGKIITRKTDV
ncbi:hypothetical protein NE237_028754 [Protea cynaroides]|uniref:Uncharacterized protein n=1 Tax=Protea cynaroides TaxID=273540 RepID=A0A9Q0GPY1_9MAGN|nr:hypothetical protein NE237_028754 [Protea cynaroides]